MIRHLSLKATLVAQTIWFVAALVFNLLSLYAISNGHAGWMGEGAVTKRATGAVCLFGLVILAGYLSWAAFYRYAVCVVTILLFSAGVVKHILAGAAAYPSSTLWMIAISINVVGTTVFVLGAVCVWRDYRLQ